jgi:hypothetical protein
MGISSIISQMKAKINELNKEAARYGALSKARYDEAAALSKALAQLEGIKPSDDSDKGSYKDPNWIHPKTRWAKERLYEYLKKSGGEKRYIDIKTELNMNYDVVKSLSQRFPETFAETTIDGNRGIKLVSDEQSNG